MTITDDIIDAIPAGTGSRLDEFVFKQNLGQGVFGRVDLVYRGSERFALKSLDKTHPRFRDHLVRVEIEALQQLAPCEYIVDLVEHWEEDGKVFMLLEFVEGMDLITILEEDDYMPVEEEVASMVFQGMAQGLAYCHSRGIAHRDVKLDNVMVDKNGKTRIVDFGLARIGDADRCTDDVGSIEYCAPEICRKDTYNGMKCDVWSAGIVLYALLFGEFPFSMNDVRTFQAGYIDDKLHFPHDMISPDAKDLLVKMLCMDAEARISMKAVLDHPWVLNVQPSTSSES